MIHIVTGFQGQHVTFPCCEGGATRSTSAANESNGGTEKVKVFDTTDQCSLLHICMISVKKGDFPRTANDRRNTLEAKAARGPCSKPSSFGRTVSKPSRTVYCGGRNRSIVSYLMQ